MDIHEHIKLLLNNKKRADIIQAAAHIARPVATKGDIKQLLATLQGYLLSNQRREAVATALSMAKADPDGTIAQLRRLGYLRISRYKTNAQMGCVTEVVQSIYDIRHLMEIRSDRLTYLESVLALHSLAPEIHKLRNNIIELLRPRKTRVLKTLMVLIDQVFVLGVPNSKEECPTTLGHYSAEDIAEAVSTLLNIFRKEFGINSKDWIQVDESILKLEQSIYNKLIIDAALFNEFTNSETLIDGLPYQAVKNRNEVTIFSTDPNFEKSVRLGYIQTSSQMNLRVLNLYRTQKENHGFQSLSEFTKSAFDAGFCDMIELKLKPHKRLVLKLAAHETFFNLFSGDHLFIEDIKALLLLNVEDYSNDIIKVTQINEKVTSLDIFKIQRLMAFISYMYREKIKTFTDEYERKFINLMSIIPAIHKDILLDIIKLTVPKGNAEEIIRLLTLNETKEHVDIQYNPLILSGDYYIISPALVANSNLVRNIICSNNLRPAIVNAIDPMEQAVVSALEISGFKVRSGFETKIAGNKRETDIFAWRDGIFFILECKNAYLPCTSHEMRNSYDQIEKASEQLDIRLDWFQDIANQEKLFKDLKWDVKTTTEVYSGIIIANRVLHGYIEGRHPVRQAHELINVISSGEIRGLEKVLNIWKGTKFHASDLVSYLTGDTLISDHFSAMSPIQYKYPFGIKSLCIESYNMDAIDHAKRIEERYPGKETRTEEPSIKAVESSLED